jgi:hypothetical protein
MILFMQNVENGWRWWRFVEKYDKMLQNVAKYRAWWRDVMGVGTGVFLCKCLHIDALWI